MAIYDAFPYTNIHELNLSFLLAKIKEVLEKTGSIDTSVELALQAALSAQENADVIKNLFVTPEMYGAKGDGINDDTQAIKDALQAGVYVMMRKKYLVSEAIVLPANIIVDGCETCEITNNSGNYTFVFDGSSKTYLMNISKIDCNYGILFTGSRSWYTDVTKVEIRANVNAIKIECPTGYNNFNKVQVYVANTAGVAVEIGKVGYSEAIQPNYIYFNNCYFTIKTAFTSNTATCLKFINGQYVNFFQCDFVSYNHVFEIICDSNSRSLDIRDSDIFAVYTLFHIINTGAMSGVQFVGNRITRQVSAITYVYCDSNSGYVNDFVFKDNTAISGGGSEAGTPWVINKFYHPAIEDNQNITYNSTVTNTTATSNYAHGYQSVNLASPVSTALNIIKNGPFNLAQPNFTLVPDSGETLTYTNMYFSGGSWYLGNLRGKGKVVW